MIRDVVTKWFRNNRNCFADRLRGDGYHWHIDDNLDIWI